MTSPKRPDLTAVPDPTGQGWQDDQARSIQGEQQATYSVDFADMGFVDKLARDQSDALALCRERYRHRYPQLPRQHMRFDGVTPSGYLTRRVLCQDCQCAIQVQRWEAYTVGKGRSQTVRVRPAYNVVEYQENPETGEVYPTKGHGMVRPRDYREARATQALDDAEAQEWAAAALRARRDFERKHPRQASESVARGGLGVPTEKGSS